MAKVFIDGAAGTTGLQIRDRLKTRPDIELITLSEQTRKDECKRAEAMSRADVVFLCLPDDAARNAVTLADKDTVIIDTSTAHRTLSDWVYGMPELEGQREKIRASKRIANPGCHASGFIALVAPLVSNGIINKTARLSCFSLTGYSGGGKKMIAEYESEHSALYDAPRQYGLSQNHKHLPEMKKLCGLDFAPVFCPVVAPFYSGMQVTVPLFDTDTEKIKEIYKDTYADGVIRFIDASDNGFVSAASLSGKDCMNVYVYGGGERAILCAVYDNLGKGASGAAIQNMNIILNEEETKGLIL